VIGNTGEALERILAASSGHHSSGVRGERA